MTFVTLSRGSTGELELQMTKRMLRQATSQTHDTYSHADIRAASLIPSIRDPVYLSFSEWKAKYEDFLRDYIDEMCNVLLSNDVIVRHTSFYNDMLRYAYDTSVSRYRKFIFLGK